MADEKKSFLLYLDYREHFELLDDEGKGRLLMALFEYAESGRIPDLPDMERMAFSFIRKQIDRDNQKYQETVQKNRSNGARGGRPKKPSVFSENPKKPSVFSETQTNPSKPKKPDKDNDKDNDNDNDIYSPHKSPQGDDVALQAESLKVETAGGAGKPVDHSTTLVKQRFNEFWREYPKKTGKGAAEKAWNKIKPDRALFDSIMSALKAVKKSDQWHRENGQYIPNPSTWLNQRRWEDEIPKPTFSAGSSSLDDDEITRLFERGSIGI